MPYASNADLPDPVKKAYSEECQTAFRKAFNAAMAEYNDEGKAMATAHKTAQGCMANMDMSMMPMKAEQLTSVKWRVLAIPFGGPFKGGKDLDGEYFSPRTDIKAEWFPTRPAVWHHGKDQTMGTSVLGTEDELKAERDGWWANLWLDRSNRYWDMVSSLLAAGKAYGSSGSLSHMVKKAPDGEILVWPHIEQTLTTMPINPYSRIVPAKALDDFTSAGIAMEAYKDLFVHLDETTDLGPDLPSGGEDSAMERRLRARANSAIVLARIKTIHLP